MKRSYVTVTDMFCGAGGSSIGAVAAGAELALGLNHWKLAIESHNSNFPDAAHDCCDVSATDPRRYPSTDVLIASPECVNHSLAKGRKRARYKADLFGKPLIDPAEDRSRATAGDIPRFAEYHNYNIVIVENVVEFRDWVRYPAWIYDMELLGYEHRAVYLNSMFAHVPGMPPAPQSRDRMYVIFWKRGNRAPDLDIRPVAWCPGCGEAVEAVQSWKRGCKAWGRYGPRGQYLYLCPGCAGVVHPYFYPAAAAIDWSLPARRIGDRDRPLAEKTLGRIRLGLERFGNHYLHLVVDRSYAGANGGYARPSARDPWPSQTTRQSLALVGMPLVGSNQAHHFAKPATGPLETVLTGGHHYLVQPGIVEMRNHGTLRPVGEALSTVEAGGNHHALLVPMTRDDRARPTGEPWPTQTGTETLGLTLPFTLEVNRSGERLHPVTESWPIQTASLGQALVTPPPFVMRAYGDPSDTAPRGVAGPLGTVTGGDHHQLVTPPFVVSYYGEGEGVHGVGEPLPTQTSLDRHALAMPFIVSQYGGEKRNPVRPVGDAMPTVPGMHVHRLAVPGEIPSVEDCGFRMLEPHEIASAMAFPDGYKVLGSKRQRVKQYGNAVTPNVMRLLLERCLATLG